MAIVSSRPLTADGFIPPRRLAKYEHALAQISALCQTLQPGDRIPALPELMRLIGASERAVLRALDELQRGGKIVRRHGAGTFVAHPSPPPLIPNAVLSAHRGVVAVRTPDNSFFDYCVNRLFHHTSAAKIPLLFRIIDNETVASDDAFMLSPAEIADSSFLLFRYALAPLGEKIAAAGGRVVIIGAPPANVTPVVPCVYSDQEEGGYQMVRHLIGLGHKRIALQIVGPDTTETLRWRGYRRALQEANRGETAAVRETVLSASQTAHWQAAPDRAKAYFSRDEAPTAIVAWNDHEAALLLVALHRAGIDVPRRVSVVGYDNLPEARIVQPHLTTMDQSVDWQLRTALQLIQRPQLPSPSHTAVIMPTLVERESTGGPVAL